MPGVQVFHIEKRVTITGGLNRHITRVQWVDGKLVVWVPDNADPDLTKDNVELVSREFTNSAGKTKNLSLQEAVNKRIKDAGIKPRKGQTRCLEMIFSGSHEEMCNMSREDLLKWADDTLKWAQKTWGKENVVSASLHLDEKTPHIHMIVVPIVQGQSRRSKKQKELDKERGIKRESYKINTEKLRLCANEVYTTPLLYHYHDHYAKDVSNKYGLERGLRAEPGSKKKHQTSEDYNRQLAAEAAEKQSLIAEIQSDYTTAITKKEAAERKQQEAETKQKEAEDKKTLIEQQVIEKESEVKELETKSSSLSGEISDKTSELAVLETKVQEQQGQVDKNKDIISEQATTISDNKATITTQATTIESNKKTIKDQEKTISSRKEVDEDALDRRINEKVFAVNRLEAEITTTKRRLFNVQQEAKIEDAKVKQFRAELKSKVNLEKVPKEGAFGFKTSEVKDFIQSVALASLQREMNRTATPVDVNEDLRTELENLRSVQDRYNELINSPELLQQQIQYLEQEKKRESIKNTIEYVTQKKVQILSFSVENSPRGEEIYTNFRFENDDVIRKGVIKANERLIYTARDYVNSYETANEHIQDKIWTVFKPVAEIRQERHEQEILSRYNTKLSNKFRTNVGLVSFEESGALKCFSSFNGTSYIVDKNNVVWTTSDKSIKVAKDCIKYLNECNWKNEGDINTLNISNEKKLKRK